MCYHNKVKSIPQTTGAQYTAQYPVEVTNEQWLSMRFVPCGTERFFVAFPAFARAGEAENGRASVPRR